MMIRKETEMRFVVNYDGCEEIHDDFNRVMNALKSYIEIYDDNRDASENPKIRIAF